ncbi:MAG TPA: hypothetical protein EYO76_01850 [Flavobacteriaceae bacterium]|nr:hypothetical protein [Flavobacteriaceae bacterium]
MISRYTYKDPIFKTTARNQNLRIESSNEILDVFRLITGTINCTDSYRNKEYKFRTNYSNFPYSENGSINQSTVLNNFPDEVRLVDLDKYFKRSRFNSSFYRSIKAELIKCLIAEKENNHLEAFFYLYRIIEGISYSIPLIYVSKHKSYNKTYKQLQSFFNKEQDGELAFFKRFVSTTFKDEDFFKSTIDISILEIDIEEIREDYYKIYLDKMKDNLVKDKTENEEINISFIGFYEFIIELRNRFFHFTQGAWMNNLSSTELLFPDYFFKPIVKHGINWVSLILFEIIKVDFEKGIK